MSWNDFNSADDQSGFDVIPKGTLAKVRMTIKPGGHDDASQGWTGGWATRSNTTGAVYLNCEFVVLEGKYARRINGLGDLDGVEFAARIDIEKDQNGDDKNVIKLAITPDNKEDASLMGAVSGAVSAPQSNSNQSASASSARNLPSWAQ